jgi:hypothetical protein
VRLAAAVVALLVLSSLLTAKEAQAQDRVPKPASLEVVLLLDRSPSANAKRVSGRPLIEDRAQKLLKQLYSLCQFYGVELRYGAANFGGKLGDVRPLASVLSPADLVLPVQQQISYTDFRVALSFALGSLQSKPEEGHSRRILFLLTDSEPWPPTSTLSPEEKNRYFGDEKDSQPGSLPALLRDLSKADIDFYVIALDDHNQDALNWRRLLPSNHYLSNRSHTNLDDAIRRLLLGFLDPSCGQPAVVEAAQPDIGTNLPDASPQSSAASASSGLRRPWYEIIIALVGILLGAMLSRVFPYRRIDIAQGSAPSPITESGEPQEPDDVEGLRRRGRKMVSIDPGRAKEFFEQAIEQSEKIAQEGENFAAVQIPAIFREILTTVYREDLLAQREYIYQQAGIKSSAKRARGLAPVLVERWSVNPELLMEEFFALQHHARGDESLQALSEFEPPGDWAPERLALISMIRSLATAADDLQRIAEFYNG